MAQHIAWFLDIGLVDRPTVGGKGASLGELVRAGIAVPPGFVVRTGALRITSRRWSATLRYARVSPRWPLGISRPSMR